VIPALLEEERTADGRRLRDIYEKFDEITDPHDFPDNPRGQFLC